MRDIQGEIQAKLLEIEKKEQVKVLFAVESGSRAWGFASPDSDYDVRFVYIRKQEDYLRLDGPRDVIEWQLDEVLDINGWDLKKALQQFHRGNATLFEWGNSPIVYKKTLLWEKIYQPAQLYFSKKAAVSHYYGTACSAFQKHLQQEKVKYKKYFYALRPLLACRYIEQYKKAPPVPFGELLNLGLPEGIRQEIHKLLEYKRVTQEQEWSPQISAACTFIEQEIKAQKKVMDGMEDDRRKEWDTLNQIFLDALSEAAYED